MNENPPAKVMVDRLVRDISTKPRVTRFQIKWDVEPSASTIQGAIGAATSAAVPSADDLGADADGDVNMTA